MKVTQEMVHAAVKEAVAQGLLPPVAHGEAAYLKMHDQIHAVLTAAFVPCGLEPASDQDTESNALQWIASTIAADKASGCYGHVESEVVATFNKFRKNHPQGSPMAQAQSAMHECAHQ